VREKRRIEDGLAAERAAAATALLAASEQGCGGTDDPIGDPDACCCGAGKGCGGSAGKSPEWAEPVCMGWGGDDG
jgi:hypothetical protein